MKPESYRVEVNGIVQGVGFRPFVYKLAYDLGLNGTVQNTSGGVVIEIEGEPVILDTFVSRLTDDAPPLSRIDSIQVNKTNYTGYSDFSILDSRQGSFADTLISPDISICPDCSRELFDNDDQRYLYPFINCTNCGPRFTIIKGVPYDRHNTTMKDFEMCQVCAEQYKNPMDRRYHAQPVCCKECGPSLFLLDNEGKPVAVEGDSDTKTRGRFICSTCFGEIKEPSPSSTSCTLSPYSTPDPVNMAVRLLGEGRILAVKGIGGYHLVCDAGNANAVRELRKRKYRYEKPFALMARDLETVKKYCFTNEQSEKLLLSAARPIVLLCEKPDSGLSGEIAPNNPELGFMLPYTPLHLLLFFKSAGKPSACPELLVMTSGNKSDEPICYKDEDALNRLNGIADYFLTNNRPIFIRNDDSVIRAFRNGPYYIRRSRGYVPAPVTADPGIFPAESPSVLATGGELKNTFCLTKTNNFFVSQHIGDLENMETLRSFEEGIAHFKKLFDIEPEIVTHDLHPGYMSTGYALSLENIKKIPVQHHHAHIASCMIDNNLSGEVIGVAFDGTGYGEDGNIWGGEFFTGTLGRFERAAQLEYFRLPGGEAAIREPWRTAAACLYQFGYNLSTFKLPGDIKPEQLEIIKVMLDKRFNSPLASSMGRLFDAAAVLTGIRAVNGFEGQAAIELENAACGMPGKAYAYSLLKQGKTYVIGISGIIDGIVRDAASGASSGYISACFHETVAEMVENICLRLRSEKNINKVVLSGGVFQNMRLLGLCIDKLKEKSFNVYIHRRVPANDGGISLGQAAIGMVHSANI